jgi:hypothetical protein
MYQTWMGEEGGGVVGGGGTGYWGRVRVVVGEGLLEREGAGDLVSNTYIVVQEHKTYPDRVHD